MFTVKEDTQLEFEYQGKKFIINISKYRFSIEDVGSGSSTGNSYTVYSSNERHVCGASGFGQGLDDVCYGCEESSRRSDILCAAYEHIIETFIVEVNESRIQESIRKSEHRKEEQDKKEREEQEAKLKAEAIKRLPAFLKNTCLPKILEATKQEDKPRKVEIGVGGAANEPNYYLAEAARCALVEEYLEVEIQKQQTFNGWIFEYVLSVSW